MDINSFTIRTAFLLLPGLLGSQLLRLLRGRNAKKSWEDLAEVLIISLLSYLLVAFISTACTASKHPNRSFLDGFIDESLPLNYSGIAWATAAALFLVCAYSKLSKRNIIFSFFSKIGVTNRYGQEDVWASFHNDKKNTWLFIRDYKIDMVYLGYVYVYSETDKLRELILRDVTVYGSDGTERYRTPQLYLSRNYDDLLFESLAPDFFQGELHNDGTEEGQPAKHDYQDHG